MRYLLRYVYLEFMPPLLPLVHLIGVGRSGHFRLLSCLQILSGTLMLGHPTPDALLVRRSHTSTLTLRDISSSRGSTPIRKLGSIKGGVHQRVLLVALFSVMRRAATG